jgi:hypothetical protein
VNCEDGSVLLMFPVELFRKSSVTTWKTNQYVLVTGLFQIHRCKSSLYSNCTALRPGELYYQMNSLHVVGCDNCCDLEYFRTSHVDLPGK